MANNGKNPKRSGDGDVEILEPGGERGRPRSIPPTEENIGILRGLGMIHATYEEVAAVFGCSKQTVINAFRDFEELKVAYVDGKGTGKVSLRRAQFALARKNAAVSIWLGKQLLGQRDVTRVETAGGDETGYDLITTGMSADEAEEAYAETVHALR